MKKRALLIFLVSISTIGYSSQKKTSRELTTILPIEDKANLSVHLNNDTENDDLTADIRLRKHSNAKKQSNFKKHSNSVAHKKTKKNKKTKKYKNTKRSKKLKHSKHRKSKTKKGIASFYAKRFHGRKTANGEIFLNNKYTAASLSIPLGSYVHVKNLRNNKSLIVKINDRGPYIKERIIDLSQSAARYLGITGLGKVKVTELDPKYNYMFSNATKQDLEKLAKDHLLISSNTET